MHPTDEARYYSCRSLLKTKKMPKDSSRADRIKQYRFTTDKSEPCDKQVNIKLPASLREKLHHKKGWHDAVREFLTEYTADVDLESA